MLEHSTLEVLVLTYRWGGDRLLCTQVADARFQCASALQILCIWKDIASRWCDSEVMCRCGQLRTLVLALDILPECYELDNLFARLPALASGAPRLRALQLVLPMLDGSTVRYPDVNIDLGPLWRGLKALSSLTSLALGWAFMQEEPAANRSERIANMLDAAQVGLAATVCTLFLHALHTNPQLAQALCMQLLHMYLQTLRSPTAMHKRA